MTVSKCMKNIHKTTSRLVNENDTLIMLILAMHRLPTASIL